MYNHNDDKTKDAKSDLEVELGIVKYKLEKATKQVVEITDQNLKYKETVNELMEKLKLAENKNHDQVKTVHEQLN